jgi:two-component system chemotaxis response regulator CheB
MEAGAVEVLAKPGGPYSVGELRWSLANKIRAAAQSRPATLGSKAFKPPPSILAPTINTRALIAIGASTGGTEAVRVILEHLPASCPPVVIVQHIPAVFSKAFADRLNKTSQLHVKEAEHGEPLLPGQALIAPGDHHMLMRSSDGRHQVEIRQGPRICYQRPSVDALFYSVAESRSKNMIGVLLTGMGADGAAGLLKMRQKGARTIAQDEASCVVYGMPREALRMGGVEQVLPLNRISEAICELLTQPQDRISANAASISRLPSTDIGVSGKRGGPP